VKNDKSLILVYNTFVRGGDGLKNTEIWVFIFSLGLLSLSWPALEIFYTNIAAYLFVIWILFIILMAFATHRTNGHKD
jgi:hypothetical protein